MLLFYFIFFRLPIFVKAKKEDDFYAECNYFFFYSSFILPS